VLHGHAAGEPSFPRRQLARVRKLMIRENSGLREDPHVRQWLENAIEDNQAVRTVYSFLQRLKALCAQTTGKTESDLKRLQAWCAEAEASGIRVLGDFARQLQAYTPQPA
jgi:stearoyl-CoA desaturase (delta-9 desaturase)